MKRIFLLCLLAATLSGCDSINGFLGEKTADYLPSWLGGLPPNVPPRPGEPGYQKSQEAARGLLPGPPPTDKPNAAKPSATKP
jgi:hypothetical protein